MLSLNHNLRQICIFHALQMTLFPMAIIAVFWKHEIGMNMTEIMILQAVFGLGVTHALMGFSFYFLITFMRGVNGPILCSIP